MAVVYLFHLRCSQKSSHVFAEGCVCSHVFLHKLVYAGIGTPLFFPGDVYPKYFKRMELSDSKAVNIRNTDNSVSIKLVRFRFYNNFVSIYMDVQFYEFLCHNRTAKIIKKS